MEEQGKKTVLIVDDDTEFVNEFAKKLVSEGLSVLTALTPKEGLDQITNHKIDFIILDFVMPEMDGISIHNLISHDMRKNIPTIILTSFPDAGSIPQELEVYIKVDTNLGKLAHDVKERLDQIQ